MLILIPSRSRHDRIGRGPLRQIPASWMDRTVVAVPASQENAYRWALNNYFTGLGKHAPQLITVSDDWRIGQKRRWLGKYAAAATHDSFLFLDDDVGFLIRKSADNWQLRDPTVEEVNYMLYHIEETLAADPLLSHMGLSAREGNNRIGVGTATEIVDRNTRIMRAVAWKTGPYLETDPTRVQGIEDFDCSLQSLRAGYENMCLYYWAQGQRETGEAGGCADWRTREVHDANVRRLAELHTPHVKIRMKQNKTGGLAERLETTISWKNAAAEGARVRDQRA